MNNTITVSAKTVDEAITKALIQLGTTSDNIKYEIIEKGSAGLFGFIGAKDAVITARRKEPDEFEKAVEESTPVKEKKPEKPTKAPVKETVEKVKTEKADKLDKPEKKAVEKKLKGGADPVESATKFLKDTLAAMGMEVQIEASFDEGEKELSVTMNGDDMGILIGKRGQTLDSLQYLVSLVVNKESEGYVRVKLDTENYRERRKETLETLAKNIAYKVKRTKRPVSLEPMNPYERRIIHSALQSDRYVVTRSEGEEPFRHVVISLKREGKKERYNNNSEK